ncbi:kinase anchor protein [Halorarum halophilum]|uniref:Kinase anchor protein n=1 Tax=Halorarum halophilum TaxID=2743090 RepID=A0A7D5GAT8_9EURY|nr:kinase anchor protein [Halobaculum halophilum]QLG26826.1 kinase anchor protein [Halobaculum halophilum]
MTDYIDRADRALAGAYEPPMSLGEYVDQVFERPATAAGSAAYLLGAIESLGTRTVVEEGEERERYRFFDDPNNDGEHAVLGNTAVLNAFVDDLRTLAAGRGKDEKIHWFDGPTATGKSELKRCLVNGLREYSKTEEGRRYTVEWNIAGGDDAGTLGYGTTQDHEDDWYESPVRTHPLSVFPSDVRRELLAELNDSSDPEFPIRVDADLDPFSREAYDYLEEEYRREGRSDLFSAVIDDRHLRVKNYVVDVGDGIGVLHAEDDGSPKERLVGSWMPGMLRELDSRGRKDPRAFSYDGVLSQGNGLLTVVEDASQHADLLRKLLNVPDERRVKLDKGIGMDLDTQLVVISNPDLDAELDQFSDRNGRDPLKALKRRLDRHEFRYLTSISLETELIHRELTNETQVWETVAAAEATDGDGADPTASGRLDSRATRLGGTDREAVRRAVDERVRAPMRLTVRDERGRTSSRELAPHALEGAAAYSVVTRLDGEDLPKDLSLVDKALLYEKGFLREGDDRVDADEFEFEGEDGVHGIPVTYTRDVIADLLHEETDRAHPDLDVGSVLMPDDILDEMAEGLDEAPVFSRAEAAEYENRLAEVKEYVFDRQERDVLDAVLAEKGVPEETVAEYVEHVFAWDAGEQVETDHGTVDPDPLLMQVFETEHLGRFEEDDYDGTKPTSPVARFRTEKVITALNRYAWEHRDEDFAVSDVDLGEIPVIREVLDTHSWEDVRRIFPDFDPTRWDDPPANTETERVKERTVAHLRDRGYSPASAELTGRTVMREVSARWD